MKTFTGHTGDIYSLVVFPDGSLASGGGKDTINTWDYSKGYTKTEFKNNCSVQSLLVLPDGSLASGCKDGSIRIRKTIITTSTTSTTSTTTSISLHTVLISLSISVLSLLVLVFIISIIIKSYFLFKIL